MLLLLNPAQRVVDIVLLSFVGRALLFLLVRAADCSDEVHDIQCPVRLMAFMPNTELQPISMRGGFQVVQLHPSRRDVAQGTPLARLGIVCWHARTMARPDRIHGVAEGDRT